jgi:hypothetical protein
MLKRITPLECFACSPGPSRRRLQVSGLLLLLVSGFGLVKSSQAQAIAAAEKTGHLNAFGSYTFTSPDYDTKKDNGFSVGGDFLLRRFIFGQPAIAARYSRVTGPTVNETFVGGGLESYYRVGFVRPYVTALYGLGGLSTHINGGHTSDSGNNFLFGGGADIPISRRFSARAEYLYGFLKISGKNGGSQGQLDLNPSSLNLGIVYHIR